MKTVIPVLALAAPLLLGAATPSAARDRNAVPAATNTGQARNCIPLHAIRSSQVRNDRVIDFLVTNRKAYRVTLPDRCPGLGYDRAFSYRTPLNQLCSTDIITVISPGPVGRGASCGLAPFQPVELERVSKPRR